MAFRRIFLLKMIVIVTMAAYHCFLLMIKKQFSAVLRMMGQMYRVLEYTGLLLEYQIQVNQTDMLIQGGLQV